MSDPPQPDSRQIRALGQRVARALTNLVGPGHNRQLVVALSGGADSSALLLLLADTVNRHGWRLRAAHLDHQIQPAAVRAQFRDAATDLCRRLDLPLHQMEVNVPVEAAQSDDGIEATARRLRYHALNQLALDLGASVVATGHTLDDQAETVLQHLIRGAGLDGLSGMPPLRPLGDTGEVQLARPLLSLRRAETELVCRAWHWRPIEDPSNQDQTYLRNRVRHALLPLLEQINPQIAQGLARLARSATADRALLQTLSACARRDLARPDRSLDRRAWLALPHALQSRTLRDFCAEQGQPLSSERTEAALSLIAQGHGRLDLGQNRWLCVADGRIWLANTLSGPISAADSGASGPGWG